MGRVDRQRREYREDPVLEQLLAELLLVAVQLVPPDQLDALLGQRGDDVLAEDRGVPRGELVGLPPDCSAPRAASGPRRRGRPRPQRSRLRPATRTMKNSSRLLAKIARKRTRSSSGRSSSSASSSTRWLNRSQDSSRSRNRSSNSPGANSTSSGEYGGSTSKMSAGTTRRLGSRGPSSVSDPTAD